MARARMLHKSVSSSWRLSLVSVEACLLHAWLVPHADNLGRFNADPAWIKATVFPRRDEFDTHICAQILNELSRTGLILVYRSSGMPFGMFHKWESFQAIQGNMSRNSEIPAPSAAQIQAFIHRANAVRTEYEHRTDGVRSEVEVEVEVEEPKYELEAEEPKGEKTSAVQTGERAGSAEPAEAARGPAIANGQIVALPDEQARRLAALKAQGRSLVASYAREKRGDEP